MTPAIAHAAAVVTRVLTEAVDQLPPTREDDERDEREGDAER